MNDEAARYYYENISYALRGKKDSPESLESTFRERIRHLARPRYHFISNFVKLEPEKDLVLELGCNDAANLVPWKEKGYRVLGVELDGRMVDFGRKKGLDIVQGDVKNVDLRNKRPALVILSHMLEHANDAGKLLGSIYEMLEPGGYLFLEVPGIRTHGLVNTLAYLDIEHNYNFDMKSAKNLLEKERFNIVYADEYVRILCTPDNRLKSSKPGKMLLSADLIAASILRFLLSRMAAGRSRLAELLEEKKTGEIRIRLFSKLQTLYYGCYYRAVARSNEKNERK